jgi:ribosomal-protein-serine acetyltransferase
VSPLPVAVDLGDGALLRKLRIEDLEEIWSLVDAERERLRPWMPWIEGTKTIDD